MYIWLHRRIEFSSFDDASRAYRVRRRTEACERRKRRRMKKGKSWATSSHVDAYLIQVVTIDPRTSTLNGLGLCSCCTWTNRPRRTSASSSDTRRLLLRRLLRLQNYWKALRSRCGEELTTLKAFVSAADFGEGA